MTDPIDLTAARQCSAAIEADRSLDGLRVGTSVAVRFAVGAHLRDALAEVDRLRALVESQPRSIWDLPDAEIDTALGAREWSLMTASDRLWGHYGSRQEAIATAEAVGRQLHPVARGGWWIYCPDGGRIDLDPDGRLVKP